MANTISGSGALSAAGGGGGSQINGCFAEGAGGLGRIRLDAFTLNLSGTLTGTVSSGQIGIVFLPNAITVRIATVNGITVPLISPGLTGTVDSSTATVNLTFPTSGVFFLEARATFTVP